MVDDRALFEGDHRNIDTQFTLNEETSQLMMDYLRNLPRNKVGEPLYTRKERLETERIGMWWCKLMGWEND